MTVRNRRFWFLLHGWLSLPVWGLLLLVCITGTIATISHEITWLANPAARALNPDGLAEKVRTSGWILPSRPCRKVKWPT